jgi:hypothetical protein
MSALIDVAYDLFGYGAYLTPEMLAEFSAACPGHAESDYREAVERVDLLRKCSDRFCSEWYDHVCTESDAEFCPQVMLN